MHLQKVAELAESKKSDYKNLLKELLLFNNTFVVFFKMFDKKQASGWKEEEGGGSSLQILKSEYLCKATFGDSFCNLSPLVRNSMYPFCPPPHPQIHIRTETLSTNFWAKCLYIVRTQYFEEVPLLRFGFRFKD